MMPPVAVHVTVPALVPPSLKCAVAANCCSAPEANVTLVGATVMDCSSTGSGPPSEPEQPTANTPASRHPSACATLRSPVITQTPIRPRQGYPDTGRIASEDPCHP